MILSERKMKTRMYETIDSQPFPTSFYGSIEAFLDTYMSELARRKKDVVEIGGR